MRKKILVVEDNLELLELLRLSFQGAGFSICTAVNGTDAVRKARALSPDAVLLDLMLPELDGLGVCERLRTHPATAALPILMLTGMSSELGRLVALGTGVNDYLAKPASPDEIVIRLKALLRTSAIGRRSNRRRKRPSTTRPGRRPSLAR